MMAEAESPFPEDPTPERLAAAVAESLDDYRRRGYRVTHKPDGRIEVANGKDRWSYRNEREVYEQCIAEWDISRQTERALARPDPPAREDDIPF
jgi:hypothetical protein